MKLIVGLGNPGKKYEQTRHNIGYMAIDQIFKQFSDLNFQNIKKMQAEVVEGEKFLLAKPTTFMNDSGLAVVALLKAYGNNPKDLYVIHDDLDIPLGTFKIQFGKGPKTHKGLLSIYEKLGTHNFWHVRVGVENRLGSRISGEEYTLMPFLPQERQIIDDVIDQVCKKLAI